MTEKRLPVAPEAERSLLGAILFGHFERVVDCGVTANDFHTAWHRDVFESAERLNQAGTGIDAITISENLRQRNRLKRVEGGEATIIALGDAVPTTSHIEHYAGVVKSRARMRRFIIEATRLVADAYSVEDAGVDEFIDQTEAALFAALRSGAVGGYEPLGSEVSAVVTDLFKRRQNPEPRGVLTGVEALDKLTNGWRAGTLSVIGARPHIGKTGLLLQFLAHAADSGTPTLIFSLEQTKRELAERRLASEAKVDLSLIMGDGTGLDSYVCQSLVNAASKRHKDQMQWVDEQAGMSIVELRARIRRWISDAKIPRNGQFKGVVGLDYIQLLKGFPKKKYQSRDLEVTDVCYGLKEIAKEFGIPIIALAQVKRAQVERADPKPTMADLRESGAIEASADFVGLLWRPKEEGSEEQEDLTRGRVEMTIPKNRSGRTGDVAFFFEGKYMQFSPMSNRDNDDRDRERGSGWKRAGNGR